MIKVCFIDWLCHISVFTYSPRQLLRPEEYKLCRFSTTTPVLLGSHRDRNKHTHTHTLCRSTGTRDSVFQPQPLSDRACSLHQFDFHLHISHNRCRLPIMNCLYVDFCFCHQSLRPVAIYSLCTCTRVISCYHHAARRSNKVLVKSI